MDQSPTIGALAGALAKAQGVLPNVRKTKTARIRMKSGDSYSYKYADLADVWDAIRTPLANNGLSVIQSPEMFEGGLGIVTTIAHESGEWLTGIIIMPVADRTPQALGTAITYLRRYGLCAMLGIVSDEYGDAQDRQEDDRSAHKHQEQNRPEKAPEKAPVTRLPDGSITAAPKRITALKKLWDRERELGIATPATDLAIDLDDPEEATVDRVNVLGKSASARIKAFEGAHEDII